MIAAYENIAQGATESVRARVPPAPLTPTPQLLRTVLRKEASAPLHTLSLQPCEGDNSLVSTYLDYGYTLFCPSDVASKVPGKASHRVGGGG